MLRIFLQNCVSFLQLCYYRGYVLQIWHAYETFENNHFLFLKIIYFYKKDNKKMKENVI